MIQLIPKKDVPLYDWIGAYVLACEMRGVSSKYSGRHLFLSPAATGSSMPSVLTKYHPHCSSYSSHPGGGKSVD